MRTTRIQARWSAAVVCLFLVLALFPSVPASAQPFPFDSFGPKRSTAVNGASGTATGTSSGATAGASQGIGAQSFLNLFRSNKLLDWGALLFLILAGLALGRFAAYLLRRFSARMSSAEKELRGALLYSAAGPTNLALITAGIGLGLSRITMDAPVRAFVDSVVSLLAYITVFWYLHNVVGDFEIVLHRFAARTETKLDTMLVPIIRKTLRLFVIIVGVLLVAENVFRQNIATWLAGLGIAGIAVSLAAQDSLKNLFGSITILFDRPFKLGDRIVFSGYDGPVEQIGFRSIKIRTLTGHLVTIPNSRVVSDAVENIAARAYIRRLMNVTITYDTPRERVLKAVQIIRDLFEEEGLREPIHGRVGSDEFPPKAYFSDYNADSLNIIVLYWFFPPSYWDYMEHAERFNLRLMEEYEKEGIEFAFPTQTLYLAGDPKRRLTLSRPDRTISNGISAEQEGH